MCLLKLIFITRPLPPSLPPLPGAYTLCMASAGFRVLTFEPMKRNARAIREGVCRNHGLNERVVLLEKGLGDKEQVRRHRRITSFHTFCFFLPLPPSIPPVLSFLYT